MLCSIADPSSAQLSSPSFISVLRSPAQAMWLGQVGEELVGVAPVKERCLECSNYLLNYSNHSLLTQHTQQPHSPTSCSNADSTLNPYMSVSMYEFNSRVHISFIAKREISPRLLSLSLTLSHPLSPSLSLSVFSI